MMVKMKLCSQCNIDKPLDEFYKRKAYLGGHTTWCKKCYIEYSSTTTQKEKKRDYRQQIKKKAILHYSNKCECCGESEFDFLTIDHINGNGNRHHREIKIGGGAEFYRWIIKNNYPKIFQVLCFNCNCGRSLNKGICPHKRHN